MGSCAKIVTDVKDYFKGNTAAEIARYLVGLLLLAVITGSAFFSFVNQFAASVSPEKNIRIEITGRGAGGGTDAVIEQMHSVQPDLFELIQGAHKQGNWNYTQSEESGSLRCNWTAAGGRVGSFLAFRTKKNGYLYFNNLETGGRITVSVNGEKKEYDLSDMSAAQTVVACVSAQSQNHDTLVTLAVYTAIYVLLAALFLFLSHFVINAGIKQRHGKGVFFHDYNWKTMCMVSAAIYLYAVIAFIRGIPNYLSMGDEAWYWTAAQGAVNPFYVAKEYSTFAFRGYINILIPSIVQRMELYTGIQAQYFWFFYVSIIAGAFIGYALPRLAEFLTGKKPCHLQVFCLAICMGIFWRFYFTCVGSDLMAISYFFLGIVFFLEAVYKKKALYCFFSGAAFSLAISYRLVYRNGLFALILAGVIFSIAVTLRAGKKQTGYRRGGGYLIGKFAHMAANRTFLLGTLLFSVGMLLICMPQMYANVLHGKWSIFPYNGEWVIGYPYTESSAWTPFCGVMVGAPYPLNDKQTVNMVANAGLVPLTAYGGWRMPELLRIFTSQIMDTILIIGKKLFLGFDTKVWVAYPDTPFQHDSRFALFSLLNYFVMGTAVYIIFMKAKLLNIREKVLWFVLFAVLIMPQTWMHVEYRYFLVGYIMMYYMVFFKAGELFKSERKNVGVVKLTHYLLFMDIYIYLSQLISWTMYV